MLKNLISDLFYWRISRVGLKVISVVRQIEVLLYSKDSHLIPPLVVSNIGRPIQEIKDQSRAGNNADKGG